VEKVEKVATVEKVAAVETVTTVEAKWGREAVASKLLLG
jgi:hypothetical protein